MTDQLQQERADAAGSDRAYDGFISYSHAADGLLAPRLQAGLQRFAKPWWKRRAVRIFRDESSLSANPHLWSSITEALDSSGWFVLLLSPDAASSVWVDQEIAYWKTNRDPSRILPVVTDGEFGWDGIDVAGTAVPEQLRGVFAEEPRWVDLRWARDEEQLDLSNPSFSAAVADVASAIRGVPKDELESEEVRQYRRTVRTAWSAGGLVLTLAVVAVWAGILSAHNATEAERQTQTALQNEQQAEANAAAEAEARAEADDQRLLAESAEAEAVSQAQLARSREFAASAIGVLDRDPELATLLALYAIQQAPDGSEQPLEVINALWQAGGSNRLVDVYESAGRSNLSLSKDGSRLAVTAAPQELRLLDTSTGDVVWTYAEDTVDSFDSVDIGADGRVAISIVDSGSPHARGVTDEVDDLPSRVAIVDGATGAHVHSIEFPDCLGDQLPVWSPDGRHLAISSGDFPICAREGSDFWVEVYEAMTWRPVAFLPAGENWGPVPVWDEAGMLYAMTWPILAFEPETFSPSPIGEASGSGAVSPDGSTFVTFNLREPPAAAGFAAFVVDAATGAVRDVLYNGDDPVLPLTGVEITSDGRYAIVGTVGAHTYVYDLATRREVFRLPSGAVTSSAYDPSSQLLYTSGIEPGIRVWDLRESTVGVTPTGTLRDYPWVNGNSFVPGPDTVAMETVNTAEGLWALQLFDSTSGEMVGQPATNLARGQALSNGKFVVNDTSESPPDTGPPILFDPVTGTRVDLLPCANPAVDQWGSHCTDADAPRRWHVVVPESRDRILAYGNGGISDFEYSGHFRQLDPDTGALVEAADPGDRSESDPLRDLGETGLYPLWRNPVLTDTWIFGLTALGFGVGAFDLATGELIYEDSLGLAFDVSADARFISYNRRGTAVSIVDTTTWEEVVRVQANGRVRGQAFNADGSRLAIGDVNGLQIVDTATGLVIQQMRLPNVSDIHWIDDDTIVIGTSTGLFGTVSLSTEDFLHRTQDHLRRSFTTQECSIYRIDPCPTLEEMRGG
jgi:WD40 repeat protein